MGHSTSCCSAQSTSVQPLIHVSRQSEQNSLQLDVSQWPRSPHKILKDACNSPIVVISPRTSVKKNVNSSNEQREWKGHLKISTSSPRLISKSPLCLSSRISFKDRTNNKDGLSVAQGDSTTDKQIESPIEPIAEPSRVTLRNVSPDQLSSPGEGKFPRLLPPLLSKSSHQNVEQPKGILVLTQVKSEVQQPTDQLRDSNSLAKNQLSKNLLGVVPGKHFFDSMKDNSSQNSEKGPTNASKLAHFSSSTFLRRESRLRTMDPDLGRSSHKKSGQTQQYESIPPHVSKLSLLNQHSESPRFSRSHRAADLLSSRKKTQKVEADEGIQTELVKGSDIVGSTPGRLDVRRKLISPAFTAREMPAAVKSNGHRDRYRRGKTLITPDFGVNQEPILPAMNMSDISVLGSSRTTSVLLPKQYKHIQNSRKRLLSGTIVETKNKISSFGVFAQTERPTSLRARRMHDVKGLSRADKSSPGDEVVPESHDEGEPSAGAV